MFDIKFRTSKTLDIAKKLNWSRFDPAEVDSRKTGPIIIYFFSPSTITSNIREPSNPDKYSLNGVVISK